MNAGLRTHSPRRALLVGVLILGAVLVGAWTCASHPAARRAWRRALRPTLVVSTPRAPVLVTPRAVRAEDSPKTHETVDPARADADATSGAATQALRMTARDAAPTTDVSHLLLLGSDRSSPGLVGRTDAILVLAFDHLGGRVAAFSIPRDLWVEIPGFEPGRINKVMRLGEIRLGRGQGLPLLHRVLEQNLGVRIDGTLRIDFSGFQAVVDGLGGLDVEVDCPFQDCFWPRPGAEQCEMITIAAGLQHMDGHTALAYVRSRHGRGDRDRTRRQQRVARALKQRLERAGLAEVPRLWRIVEPHVETDLDWRALLYYASFAIDVAEGSVGGFQITRALVQRDEMDDGKRVLRLVRPEFDAARRTMFDRRAAGLRNRRRCAPIDAALVTPRSRRPAPDQAQEQAQAVEQAQDASAPRLESAQATQAPRTFSTQAPAPRP